MRLTFVPRFKELRWRRVRHFAALFVSYMRENRLLMGTAMACGLGATAMRLLRPWPLKLLFDGVLIPSAALRDQPLFAWILGKPTDVVILIACLGLLAITLLWGFFSYWQAYLTARAGQTVVYGLRRRVYSHLLRLSLRFHQRRQHGDLVMRLTGDINLLRDMLVDATLLGISELMMLVAMVTVMAIMDVRMTLVALAIFPLMSLTTFRFSIRIRDAARRQRQKEGRVAAMVSEMLHAVQLIQAFGREAQQESRFQRGNRKSLKAGLRTTRLEASMSRIIEILLAAGTAAVLWFGVHRVQNGVLTPGDLLVFISYLHSSYRPLRKLARVSTRMSKAVVCAERVTEVLQSEPEVDDAPDAKKAYAPRGAIELRRVSFRYQAGRRALHRVSFGVEPGSFVGIVGPSGAGKSTMLALLLRLYDPNHGKVLLDGRDLRRYRIQSIRDQMSVVLQEPILFGSSIRDNLIFGNPDASDDEIERCARLANAHDFICELPQGYDAMVAEAGANLSVGQRQRLAIARAFLRDAPVLLMDEPTHGLDASAERDVMKALRRLMQGRTTLMVAHKLATVQDADQILVLKHGRLIESGTHDELMRLGGWYADSCSLQVMEGVANEASPLPSDGNVIALEPRRRHDENHLRGWSAASSSKQAEFDPAILDPDAVATSLAEAGLRPNENGALTLERAWPLPRIDLMALFHDSAAHEKRRWWSIHATPSSLPGFYRRALKRGQAVILEDLGAIAQRFPDDVCLHDLDLLTRSTNAQRVLAPRFKEILGEWDKIRARVISYKPTRRCVVRYRLDQVGGKGRTLYGKCFRAGVAEEQWRLHAALAQACEDDGLQYLRFARPAVLVSEFHMLLWRKEGGERLRELLGSDREVAGSAAAGRLLADLHRSTTAWKVPHGRDRELGTTAWWAGTVATAFPRMRPQLALAVEEVRRVAALAPVGKLVPSHRDFYDKQIVVNDGAAVLMDLETASRAEPELDVANFLAHLQLRALQDPSLDTQDTAVAFLEAYSQRLAPPDPSRLELYSASALLRLACVYALRRGWGELSSTLVEGVLSNQPTIQQVSR